MLSACLNGTVVPLADVKDEAFASGALGDGIAIEPTDGELVAPADGEISSTFETHHAVGMTTVDGAELLMHIGIDTVKLGGKHFTYLVNEGDKVKKGQPLIRFELEAIKAEGYPVTTPLIVCTQDLGGDRSTRPGNGSRSPGSSRKGYRAVCLPERHRSAAGRCEGRSLCQRCTGGRHCH